VVLLITHHLGADSDHDAVVDAIDRLGTAIEIQPSVWILATEHSVQAAFDHVAVECVQQDSLFVGPLEIGGMWRNSLCGNDALMRVMAAGRG
jgi:hypothetical protein